MPGFPEHAASTAIETGFMRDVDCAPVFLPLDGHAILGVDLSGPTSNANFASCIEA